MGWPPGGAEQARFQERAGIGGGLENRFGRFRPTRVQIPPPPLHVRWTANARRRMIVGMASGSPTGVVTLLFTDVEGSTRLLHELGDDYGEALHEHRRRLRAAFAEHEGVEVDTQGEAFFVVFARASNAVAAAADCQRALVGGPIRVRMGLHTGEPRLTEEGYVGLDVHKSARIAAVGHGGQVLMSEPTKALVDADVRDLGAHRLKDLSTPERIYQLEIDGLPSELVD